MTKKTHNKYNNKKKEQQKIPLFLPRCFNQKNQNKTLSHVDFIFLEKCKLPLLHNQYFSSIKTPPYQHKPSFIPNVKVPYKINIPP